MVLNLYPAYCEFAKEQRNTSTYKVYYSFLDRNALIHCTQSSIQKWDELFCPPLIYESYLNI